MSSSKKNTNNNNFTSEGFDLDAIAAAEGGGEVIYELGGGASTVPAAAPTPAVPTPASKPASPIDKSEEWKAQGNQQFKLGNYLEAYDMYTEAIDACPGELKGDDILKLREEFDERQEEKAYQRRQDELRRQQQSSSSKNDNNDNNESSKQQQQEAYEKEEFRLDPTQFPFGDKLAIYYCNRAACLMHLDRYEDSIRDCDCAILLNPRYVKAFVRRSASYEKSERTEDALRDAKRALELDPQNATVKQSVKRLQKIEDERLEKLKEETIGKLKDLGNSILGNFGLSIDNFNAVQDPSTGSYSISFDQNANKK